MEGDKRSHIIFREWINFKAQINPSFDDLPDKHILGMMVVENRTTATHIGDVVFTYHRDDEHKTWAVTGLFNSYCEIVEHGTYSTQGNQEMEDTRPTNCRFRLKDEGKEYPRGSCHGCGKTFRTGFPPECQDPVPDPVKDPISAAFQDISGYWWAMIDGEIVVVYGSPDGWLSCGAKEPVTIEALGPKISPPDYQVKD